MTRRRFAKRPVALLLVVTPLLPIGLDTACFGPPSVGFELHVPSSVSSRAAWIEIGAFSQVACPSAHELAGGVAMGGTVAHLVFAEGDKAPPAFGDLPKASYAFAAVARAADCSVVGEGCSVVDENSGNDISITLAPLADPAGACEPGSVCVDAVCVEQGDAGDVGPGCALAFVGGGPLADPLGFDTTLLSPPAIVATGSGFLLAYREFDPEVGDARLTLLAVDDSGASLGPQRITLEDRCTGSPESDGTALAWSGSSGVVAVARQPCMANPPGVDIFAVDAQGGNMGGGFSPTAGDTVLLSQAHALAFTPKGLLLASVDVDKQLATVTTIDGTTLGAPTSSFSYGNVTGATGAYVTATSLGMGLLSLGAGVGGDGGSSGEEDGSPDPPPSGDGGEALAFASITAVTAETSLGAWPPSNDIQGSWVSLSGVDSRILVTSNGSASNPIVWYAFDIGAETPGPADSFAPQVMGNVAYTDVALYADNAFFAAQVADSISLFAFRKASTYPEFLVETDFASDTRIPIGSIRDGLVAVTADATRVAVVWGTGKTVSSLEDLGGYAVFACVP